MRIELELSIEEGLTPRNIISIILLLIYIIAFTGMFGWYSGFIEAQKYIFSFGVRFHSPVNQAYKGIFIIYLMAITSLVFVFLTDKLFSGIFLAAIALSVMLIF